MRLLVLAILSVRLCRDGLPPRERQFMKGSGPILKRRDLLKLGGMALAQTGAARMPLLAQAGMGMSPAGNQPSGDADYTLRIAPVTVELDRSHILSTIGY